MRVIARLTLDRVVENVFAETEQAAFCTQNIVPGVDFSNDPLLQGRNFSYLDTQLKRLGSTNFTQLPVNAPRCPVAHFRRHRLRPSLRVTTCRPRRRCRVRPVPRSWPSGRW